jgi:hypothetical protein
MSLQLVNGNELLPTLSEKDVEEISNFLDSIPVDTLDLIAGVEWTPEGDHILTEPLDF